MMNTLLGIIMVVWSGTLMPRNDSNKFVQEPLRYEMNAFEPVVSEQTMNLHSGRHQKGYVDNLNKLKAGTPFDTLNIEEIVLQSSGPLFNNAAQAWNHTFYFQQLVPAGSVKMTPALEEAIIAKWGSVDSMKQEMVKKGSAVFGSGWIWLVRNKAGELELVPTSNAGNPLTEGMTPLMVLDVWEHAYYVDYYNKRTDHLNKIFEIIDWKLVEDRLNAAKKGGNQ